jgi:hypothetical protein
MIKVRRVFIASGIRDVDAFRRQAIALPFQPWAAGANMGRRLIPTFDPRRVADARP